MTTNILRALAFASLLPLGAPLAYDSPSFRKIEQNQWSVGWRTVTRVTIGQKSTRSIRLTGPWLDYVRSATASNGVSARNFSTKMLVGEGEVTMILDATASATRGDMSLRLNIACPVIPLDCKSSINLPVKVLETGPITAVYPNGVVPPNTVVTFDLQGDGFDAAKLLGRLTLIGNPTILERTNTTMKVRGTTPSCGYIDISLNDSQAGDEDPYRKETTTDGVLAGTICGQSLAPRIMRSAQCPPGQTWDAGLRACRSEDE